MIYGLKGAIRIKYTKDLDSRNNKASKELLANKT